MTILFRYDVFCNNFSVWDKVGLLWRSFLGNFWRFWSIFYSIILANKLSDNSKLQDTIYQKSWKLLHNTLNIGQQSQELHHKYDIIPLKNPSKIASKIHHNIDKESRKFPQKYSIRSIKTPSKLLNLKYWQKSRALPQNYNIISTKKAENCFKNYVSAKFVKNLLRNI